MKKSRLIFRNLWFYRKPWMAVLAGASISIAVLTGALAVGDSVRYSLQRLTDIRLGKTGFVLQSRDYLFRDSLAVELSVRLNENIAPVFLTEGIAVNSEKEKRINRVAVIGIDHNFPGFWNDRGITPGDDEAVISQNAALKLELQPGDEFLLRIRKQSNISGNAPFAADKESSVSLRLKVNAIAPDDSMGRFSLKSNQSASFNIFISLKQLNAALELNGKANVLLIPGERRSEGDADRLDSLLGLTWQPADLGLKTRKLDGTGQYEITSERIFMDEKTAEAVRSSVNGCSSILTYLANSLGFGGRTTPYSFVSAVDGSFPGMYLAEGEIIINEWLADDLHARKGDSLSISYYLIGPYLSLNEERARFIIRSVIPMNDPMCDPSLMPYFPGMSEAGNCRDWETATPIDMDRIRDKDEKYWKDFRGTPKAFISLETGQKLWKNSFGSYTAFRFRADDRQVPAIERTIMQKLKPQEEGLLFIPVSEEGKAAASESTDFGGLFLGLSFFIIAAGLLLMSIIFSVHTFSRLTETAVLSSMGFRKNQVVRILLAEASAVILLAGIIGSILGIGYNRLMLLGLNTLWQDTVRTSSLQMHFQFQTLATGAAAGIIMAFLVVLFILHRKMRNPLVALLHGASSTTSTPYPFSLRGRSLGDEVKTTLPSSHFPGFFPLVCKNIRLKLKRTIGAVVLLAIGTFTIIITGANRRIMPDAPADRQSGTGGFLFWAETTIPILYDLNTPEGKKQFVMEHDSLLSEVRFLQMQSLDGGDASCLNLNRVSQPVLLGVDAAYLDNLSAFTFQSLIPSIPHSLSPWKVLEHPLSEGVITGIADETVIKWSLGRKVGDTLTYIDESGNPLRIKLVAGLDNSIFQGNILISDSFFRKYFPSAGGSRIMLIDGPFEKRKEIGESLEQIFRDYGMVVTPASQRLDEFNSVQNTYLSVFMMLGGLGVVIGTFGLGFLLIRNLQERKHELATYIALGFRKNYITRILVAEHLMILGSGIILGTVSGLAAIIPSLLSPSSDIPFGFLSVMISVIFLSGLLWIIIPVRSSFRENTALELKKDS